MIELALTRPDIELAIGLRFLSLRVGRREFYAEFAEGWRPSQTGWGLETARTAGGDRLFWVGPVHIATHAGPSTG
ncbi:MAG: hypothetical protein AAF311_02825 [Pseudomonadota bacterium]